MRLQAAQSCKLYWDWAVTELSSDNQCHNAVWRGDREQWRRYTPSFEQPVPDIPIAKALDRLLAKHCWSRNRFMRKLRQEGATIKRWKLADGSWKTKTVAPRRLSIRTEREQTLDALTRAMLYCADYDPSAPYLFEVKASIERLAELIGQLHEYEPGYDGEDGQYRHGRKSCDPVHGALDDMEAAELILVVREFDTQSGTYKAARIFFMPKLFISLGLTLKETRAMLHRHLKWQEKKGLTPSVKEKRKKELLRLATSERVATLNRPSLRNLLARIRREFTGDNKHTKQVMESEKRLKEAEAKLFSKKKELPESERRVRELKMQLAPIVVWKAETSIKQKHAQISTEEFNQLLIEILESHT